MYHLLTVLPRFSLTHPDRLPSHLHFHIDHFTPSPHRSLGSFRYLVPLLYLYGAHCIYSRCPWFSYVCGGVGRCPISQPPLSVSPAYTVQERHIHYEDSRNVHVTPETSQSHGTSAIGSNGEYPRRRSLVGRERWMEATLEGSSPGVQRLVFHRETFGFFVCGCAQG